MAINKIFFFDQCDEIVHSSLENNYKTNLSPMKLFERETRLQNNMVSSVLSEILALILCVQY